MTLAYRIALSIYRLIIFISSFFNEKAKLFIRGRKNWKKSLSEKVNPSSDYIWVHCASLGEFEQGRPLIEGIKKEFPSLKIALTFFSPSGYEIRKNYAEADLVFYLPIDTPKNAKTFIDILKPKKAIFIKYEYWYFYIQELNRQNIPLYIVSAIFRKEQSFFKSGFVGKWFRNILFKFDHIFIQNEFSAKLLSDIGIKNTTISGDTRFDRVAAIASEAREIPLIEEFKGQNPLIIVGSSWKPDEELLSGFIHQHKNVKFILAPHEVSSANVNRLQELLKTSVSLFSEVDKSKVLDSQVLIIDSIGILSSVYRYGTIAYIGGGFGVGIHNILEAATFGLPVVFGPNYIKFKEAVDLAKSGGAFPICNADELQNIFNQLLEEPLFLETTSQICKKYISKNVGSSKIILEKVFYS